MKLLTGLFRAARKRLMTTDNDMGMFRTKLDELVASKDSLSDEEVTQRVEELKQITNDLPDNDDKSKLVRFLEDFKAVKEQDEATAKEAAKAVADMFEKLDTEAMKDTPETAIGEAPAEEAPATEGEAPVEETTTEETVEEKTEDAAEPETLAEYAEGNVKEDIANAKGEVKDGDEGANAQYTLEEIYQFIKKRMAEDEAPKEGEEPVEEETEEIAEETEAEDAACGDDDKKDGVVTDNAPHIPVTVKDNAPKGSLAALFDLAKRG